MALCGVLLAKAKTYLLFKTNTITYLVFYFPVVVQLVVFDSDK